MTLARKQTAWLFPALAATVCTIVFLVSRSRVAHSHPAPIALAALCDLTITMPFLYYLLLVRPRGSSPVPVLAVLFAGARAAALLLPPALQSYLPGLRWVGAGFEVWVVTAVVRRLRRTDTGGDAIARIRSAANAVLRNGWAADVVAAEVEVFYYALFSWRAQPQTKPGSRAFSCADASGYLAFSTLLAAALVVEGVPMHLLLIRWSRLAAWICTGLDGYALLLVLAMARSLRLRPILVGEHCVLLQSGNLWQMEIARDNIKSCRRMAGPAPARNTPGYLPLVVINEPQWLIELHAPAIARGPYGRTRLVTRIGVAVDDSEAFAATWLTCGF